MQDVISLKNVSKIYPGVQALKQVDFNLERGELHCLVGENGSGKSTLVKIISGVVQPEPGAEIVIDSEGFHTLSAHTAIKLGIRVIYQDLALFPNLTIKENIAFQHYSESDSPFVNWKNVTEIAQEALDIIDLKIDLDREVGTLSIAEQQLIEITHALVGDLKLLILDEPTASLTRKEVKSLFSVIKRLQSRGVTTLFVSHKLNEIFEIAERVTVLRDGEKIGIYQPSELDHDKLVYLMTGQKIEHTPPAALTGTRQHLLEVRGLSKTGNYRDISFNLAKGEILGITGLLGSGRTELALSIFGMNPPEQGEILVEGEKVQISSNVVAQKLGIGYVPENRLTQGVIMDQSILDNMTITVLRSLLNKFGLIDEPMQQQNADKWIKQLSIKVASQDLPVKTLSGGNQQKVVLSKWLATNPKILILDEPTVGIDVYAKNSVHTLVKELASQGMGILLISDEIQEVLVNCHRILVMDRGIIVKELHSNENSEAELLENFNLA